MHVKLLSDCGPGSELSHVQPIMDFIDGFVKKNGIKVINDIGCGDLYWVSMIDMDVTYTGYDDCIRTLAKERLKPNWKLVEGDIAELEFSDCDLAICKDVFRHNSTSDNELVLEKIKKTSQYLIADFNEEDHYLEKRQHKKLSDGQYYDIQGNLTDIRKFLGEPKERFAKVGNKWMGLWEFKGG